MGPYATQFAKILYYKRRKAKIFFLQKTEDRKIIFVYKVEANPCL